MNFKAAFESMKAGKALALPEWGGYWLWDEAGKTTQMHCKDGSIVDMRDSPDMEFTLSHTFRDDWMVVEDVSTTEHKANV